mgnify:CR=1 FL=1
MLEREGGSADDLKGAFDLSAFKGEQVTGEWKLEVTDSATRDTGTLHSWGLEISTQAPTPPPSPKPSAGAPRATSSTTPGVCVVVRSIGSASVSERPSDVALMMMS